MTYLRYLPLLLFAVLLTFTSCEKENIDTEDTQKEIITPKEKTSNPLVSNLRNGSNTDGLDLGCIVINYPFGFALEDGSSVTVNSESDFETIFNDSTFCCIVDFVYPLTITDADGVTSTVNDGEELGAAFAACIPDGGWTADGFPAFLFDTATTCIRLVYPVNLIAPDSTTYTANNETEFIDLIAQNDLLFFVFPLQLTDEDGNSYTANNGDEIFEFFALCDGFGNPCDTTIYGDGSMGCYDLVFPVTVILADGSTATANDENEFSNLLIQGNVVDFQYPLSLTDEDGNPVTAADAEELGLLLTDCYQVFNGGPGVTFLYLFSDEGPSGVGCYSINYPLSMTLADGTTTVVNTIEEYEAATNDPANPALELVYPVTVTMLDGSGDVILNSFEDLQTLIDDCQ